MSSIFTSVHCATLLLKELVICWLRSHVISLSRLRLKKYIPTRSPLYFFLCSAQNFESWSRLFNKESYAKAFNKYGSLLSCRLPTLLLRTKHLTQIREYSQQCGRSSCTCFEDIVLLDERALDTWDGKAKISYWVAVEDLLHWQS